MGDPYLARYPLRQSAPCSIGSDTEPQGSRPAFRLAIDSPSVAAERDSDDILILLVVAPLPLPVGTRPTTGADPSLTPKDERLCKSLRPGDDGPEALAR